MRSIETESDWDACEEPSLFFRREEELTDEYRYRFLALRWAKRFVHYFRTDWELAWYQAFEKWVIESKSGSRMECEAEMLIPLARWAPRSPGRAIQFFFLNLRNNQFFQASIEAGEAASLDTPFPHDEMERVRTRFQGESKLAREERNAAEDRIRTQWLTDHEARKKTIGREFCNEFRCVAGNPFRPVTFDSSWRTSAVLELAQTIDREQKYDLLPILADVLEEAGCSNADILNHCRNDKTHVKGCWVIDLATGVIDSTSGVNGE